ncbi:hypothetical protein [Mycoplasma seminis]|uniref:Fic family protein n=1 Tax=Mycoplasma seminis TaxID=512749 RepID=A0ABY9HA15_9MOLU|nr:hypothetical protein [Mycoplasma seminis]WLP85414.1 hypothetical protein Q8852_03775 [Mycoplasma seminis]
MNLKSGGTMNLKSSNILDMINSNENYKNELAINFAYSNYLVEADHLDIFENPFCFTYQQVEELFLNNQIIGPKRLNDVYVVRNLLNVFFEIVNNETKLDLEYMEALHRLLYKDIKEIGGFFVNKQGIYLTNWQNTISTFYKLHKAEIMHLNKQLDFAINNCNNEKEKYLRILNYHLKFENLEFIPGVGWLGRVIMFKQCLDYNLVPIIIQPEEREQYFEFFKNKDCEKYYEQVLKVNIEDLKQEIGIE